MSSPIPEIGHQVVQESLCPDLFRSISESIEASSYTDPEIESSVGYSNDVIGQLLDQMIQILPPEERNIFGCAEERNIEEIIEEANELIRTTTPLFSSSESAEKSLKINAKSVSCSDKNSQLSIHRNRPKDSSSKEISENDSICSSLESIIVKDRESNVTPTDQQVSECVTDSLVTESEVPKEKRQILFGGNPNLFLNTEKLLIETNTMAAACNVKDLENEPAFNTKYSENEQARNMKDSENEPLGSVKDSGNNSVPTFKDSENKSLRTMKDSENEPPGTVKDFGNKSGRNVKYSENKSARTVKDSENERVITKQNVNENRTKQSSKVFSNKVSKSGSAEEKLESEVENKNKDSPQAIDNAEKGFPSELEFARQKHVAELQELKMAHSKEICVLTEQITNLNGKIHYYQKQSKVEKRPFSNDQTLEHLEKELKSQEELVAGYEKENIKLCKEISSLKGIWKQREAKLLEDKQRLQNELLGMVSKSTTEALEEQLKDAKETIVKLQIELTTYKSKNKELEAVCERLRGENQRLQAQLMNCHCDSSPSPSRRDRYSFLASSSVGHQIQELKNVIARKDVEIAQMNTTVGILKGELNQKSIGLPGMYSPLPGVESHSLTVSQLQSALATERQNAKELVKEKELLMKENLDLKRQVRELESIVKRRQRTDSCFPITSAPEAQPNSRLLELEKELNSRRESLSTLHSQFLNMQKKYEDHIQELEDRLKECREELQTLKANQKKEESILGRSNAKKFKQGTTVVKEETHLLATIRGLRQEAATREKEMNKLNKEIEEVRQTNKRLQKEREKHLTMPNKMSSIREKANLRKVEKISIATESRPSTTSPNNNINPLMLTELQESNVLLKSKTKSLQEEVKRLEQDLIAMHNKRVHDLNVLQNEHELEMARLLEDRSAYLTQDSASELQGQLYTQQMVINHLKNRLKQMEELKNEVTLLRAERDHLEQSLAAVNKKMCYLQNAQTPESNQYKTLLAKLETLEKNQEIREQKLNAVRELLSRSTQGGAPGGSQCGGSCRDKLLDKNRQICFYRAQMDRILEALLEIRRTK